MLYETLAEFRGLQRLVSLEDDDLKDLYSHPIMYIFQGGVLIQKMSFQTVSPCDARTI